VNRNDLVFLKAIWHKMRYVWPGSAKVVGNRVHCSSVDFYNAKISSANIFLISPELPLSCSVCDCTNH